MPSPQFEFRPPEPHPVACFGFGGRLALMFPRAVRRLNVLAPGAAVPAPGDKKNLRPGLVRVGRLWDRLSAAG